MKNVSAKDLFLFSWRKLWLIVVVGFVGIILHNVISGLFGFEEAFFFILVIFVLPIYFLVCVIYSVIYLIRKKIIKTRGDHLDTG
jgi:hypothetical protein